MSHVVFPIAISHGRLLCKARNLLPKTVLQPLRGRWWAVCLPCSCVSTWPKRGGHPIRLKHSGAVARGLSMSDPEKEEEALAAALKAEQSVKVSEVDGWLNVGPYSVFAWSVSGVESCIVVKSDDVSPVAFDMGAAVPESVKANHVFITHGHPDHVGGVSNHAAKRGMFGMKPARYHVPPHLVGSLRAVTNAHWEMSETYDCLKNVKILPFEEGDTVRLNHSHYVKTFPTTHRIRSQGYIVYREERRLKEEFKGLGGFEVASLHRQGTEIHDVFHTPEVAYTGDTVFDVFLNPPTPDLLKVKLLITEATFVGDETVAKARSRGHNHLSEFADNEALFQDVGHIVLVHFSTRYPVKYINAALMEKLPASLRVKVTPGVIARASARDSKSSIL